MTIIYGGNDSGKSLLARAILDVLWGAVSGKTLLDKQIWDSLYIEISLTNSRRRYRFTKSGERHFSIKKFERDKEVELFNNEKPEIGYKNAALDVLLGAADDGDPVARSYPIMDLDSAITLSFLPPPVDLNREEILKYDSFRHLFLDDKSRFYSMNNQIMEVFDHERFNHRFNNLIFNEILKSEGQIRELEKDIQIIDIQNSKFEKLKRERQLIDDEINELGDELSKLRNRKTVMINVLKNLKRREVILHNVDTIKNEIDSANEKAEQTATLKKELEESYPQFRNFNEAKRQNLKKIHRCYREIRDKNEKIDHFESRIQSRRKKFKNLIISIFISSAIAILFLANNILITISRSKQFILIIGLLALSALSIMILIVVYMLSKRSREFDKLRGEKAGIEENLKKILLENNVTLSDLKLESLYGFLLQYFEEFGEFTEKQLELFRMRDQMEDTSYIKKLKQDLYELEREKKEIDKVINSDLQSIDEDSIERDQARINSIIITTNNEIKMLKEKIKNKKNVLLQVLEEVQQHIDNHEGRLHLIEKKNKLHDNLRRLNSHTDSMNYILKIFSEAIERREGKQLQQLIDTTIENFNFLTNNQYIASIDKDTVKDLIKGNTIIEKFNPATMHLLFLSVKIAITYFLIDSRTNFPLIIDEPFIFMDDIRAEKLRTILQEISKFRQVIIFTHNSSYRDWGGYIEL